MQAEWTGLHHLFSPAESHTSASVHSGRPAIPSQKSCGETCLGRTARSAVCAGDGVGYEALQASTRGRQSTATAQSSRYPQCFQHEWSSHLQWHRTDPPGLDSRQSRLARAGENRSEFALQLARVKERSTLSRVDQGDAMGYSYSTRAADSGL